MLIGTRPIWVNLTLSDGLLQILINHKLNTGHDLPKRKWILNKLIGNFKQFSSRWVQWVNK